MPCYLLLPCYLFDTAQLGYSGEQAEVDDPSLEELTRLPTVNILLQLTSFNDFHLVIPHHCTADKVGDQDAGQEGERIPRLHRGGDTNPSQHLHGWMGRASSHQTQ